MKIPVTLEINFGYYFREAFDTETHQKVIKPIDDEAFEDELFDGAKRVLIDKFFTNGEYKDVIQKIILDNKEEIINKVIDKVSKSLLMSKQISDFRKQIKGE